MKGFTLIELLIVIAIIAILMAATLVAINPFKHFAQANNANRWSGVNTIMNAISQRMVDNQGRFAYDEVDATVTDCPATGDDIPDVAQPMRNDDANATTDEYDICAALVPDYVGAMPFDPLFGAYTSCADYDTDYTISCTDGRITICATHPQLGETICVTR